MAVSADLLIPYIAASVQCLVARVPEQRAATESVDCQCTHDQAQDAAFTAVK